MLQHITIKNFALIDSLELSFSPGTTMLTGETGAGKSVILGAITLALGARAKAELIKHGATQAEITLTLDIQQQPALLTFLEEQAIDTSDACIIRRVLFSDGKSRCYLNGSPITLQLLRQFTQHCISIHGQHDNQCLLQREEQTAIIDKAGKHGALLDNIKHCVRTWKDKHSKLQSIAKEQHTRQERQAFLAFQLREFETLPQTPEEINSIIEEHQRLLYAETLSSHYDHAIELLNRDQGTLSQLETIQQCLNKIEKHDARVSSCHEFANTAIIQCQELMNELQQLSRSIESDPARLQTIEQHMQTIHALSKKHQVAEADLPERLRTLQEEYEALTTSDESIEALKKEIAHLENEYQTVATQLTQKRLTVAKQLSRAITDIIQTLGMPNANFTVEAINEEKTTPSMHGNEMMAFFIATNPGHPAKPLERIASGGELSRVSLAIQKHLAEFIDVPTIFFDEVDTGISGATSSVIGKLLKTLGTTCQVICITHQPQVAAFADQHWTVQKETDKTNTSVTITPLSKVERTHEIARMLSGIKMTKQTLAHAEEMLALSV